MPPAEPPPASSPEVSERMKLVRRRDIVRSALHRRGLRFRVDVPFSFLARHRADVVFGPAKLVVFVDGCFWHGCPLHGETPKANSDWWRSKIERVQRRDRKTDAAFRAHGWEVLRVWEHKQASEAADRVQHSLRARRPDKSGECRHLHATTS
jgi:DNA mismatch endonuclease (patch repair protein)